MLICEVLFIWRHWRKDHLNACLELLLVREGLLKTINVKGVSNEVLIDVDEELMPLEAAEPLDPA
jgi:hypothetical protein